MKKKTGIWVFLIAVPIPGLIVNFILFAIISALLPDPHPATKLERVFAEPSTAETIVRIISYLIGAILVVVLILLPLWIIMLVLAISHNNKLKQQGLVAQPQSGNQYQTVANHQYPQTLQQAAQHFPNNRHQTH